MSAEAIHLVFTDLSATPEKEGRTVKVTKDKYNVTHKLPFEAFYQLYFAPEPTPEQIAMEEFLLGCD